MRAVLVLAAGCSFQPGALARDDGAITDDATRDGQADDTMLRIDAGLCGGKIWFADFSGDPTTYDNNGDSVNDFKARTGTFPTAQLMSGEWRVPGTGVAPLDMQPVQAFTTRTLVRTRMRGTASNGAHGAVFYINVAITASSYAALFADAHLTGVDEQEVNFVNPIAGQGDTELMSIQGFDGAPIEIELDIDPAQLSFTYRINGTPGGPLDFVASNVTTSAGFGTLTAYSTAAAFDLLYVEVCP